MHALIGCEGTGNEADGICLKNFIKQIENGYIVFTWLDAHT